MIILTKACSFLR